MTANICQKSNMTPGSAAQTSISRSGTSKPLSTVDVVIPCYNYARYLRACVHSVLSQSAVAVRVLVIDDASSDDTAQVGRELAASDGRVEFRQHRVNKGNVSTYNEGLIDWSTAEYTVLLSADDILALGSLSRATQVMDSDETIGMVYGKAIQFEHESEIQKVGRHGWDGAYTRWTGAEWIERRCRAPHNVISSPEVVVRGSVQRSVGGYRPELPYAGDLEMWLRIAAVSNIAYVRGVPQAFYRVHPASMLRTKYGSLADFRQRKAVFDAFFVSHRHMITDADWLWDLANRALAREALWDACRAYDRDQVQEACANDLIEFATGAYPRITSVPEYRALRRRQRLGAVICNRTQLFAATALVRRIGRWVSRRRWKRRGV